MLLDLKTKFLFSFKCQLDYEKQTFLEIKVVCQFDPQNQHIGTINYQFFLHTFV